MSKSNILSGVATASFILFLETVFVGWMEGQTGRISIRTRIEEKLLFSLADFFPPLIYLVKKSGRSRDRNGNHLFFVTIVTNVANLSREMDVKFSNIFGF